MTNTELNLALAKLIKPSFDWIIRGNCVVSDTASYSGVKQTLFFDYENKICAFDMVIWLSKQHGSDFGLKFSGNKLRDLLSSENPQLAVAEEVIKYV